MFTYTEVKYANQFHISEFISKDVSIFFNENIIENSLNLINIKF
jgi:hypothetical protein